ncbi:PI-stichotoxin-She2a-like [Stomoxys calcitrans]|uniref:PI-stichotoxin-She2a-like n=1 Tax=Stomoxys calcitrans TaxID=35570 RepID=UPI0027E32831|nr:PI-stichotoxin-She2a-like [Stomoxys calcitrans]
MKFTIVALILGLMLIIDLQAAEGAYRNDVCSQPLVIGNCFAAFQRFGFDASRGQCVQFLYGGCGANANNFETYQQCQATCGRAY